MALTKRQNEIIDAALELTAHGGIQNLTIKNLAEALGITEPAIYRHFKSKSAIVMTIIERFDITIPATNRELHGFDGIAAFIRARFRQVAETPSLARVMFAEELFMDDEAFSRQLMAMMHRHKDSLQHYFDEAQAGGEIRKEIPSDQLFRLIFGPVRLMIKQWGMSGGAFDLAAKGDEMLDTFRKILG